jgi:anti-anti-sigma regulatory factor
MDSTGIKFLLDGRDAAGRLGVEIAIAHGGDPIERILTVAGVTTLFERQD